MWSPKYKYLSAKSDALTDLDHPTTFNQSPAKKNENSLLKYHIILITEMTVNEISLTMAPIYMTESHGSYYKPTKCFLARKLTLYRHKKHSPWQHFIAFYSKLCVHIFFLHVRIRARSIFELIALWFFSKNQSYGQKWIECLESKLLMLNSGFNHYLEPVLYSESIKCVRKIWMDSLFSLWII